jgi:UDP-glucose 4-epimerase
MKAIIYLRQGYPSAAFNLGNGKGFSVKQIIEAAEEVTGKKIPFIFDERRIGDPSILVADASLANDVLGWTTEYQDVRDIIKHAWNWEKKYPW